MIFGIGVDIVETARMRRAIGSRWGQRFLEKVFTTEEIARCSAAPDAAQCYAAGFAAKEATVKALGTGFAAGVVPLMIYIPSSERSRPRIVLQGIALEIALTSGITKFHVSLTHTPTVACAFVTAETET